MGRVVHYVSFGTPGGEYAKTCRAAVITQVNGHAFDPKTGGPAEAWDVGLAVLNPSGMFFHEHVVQHEGGETPGNPNCTHPDTHGNPFRYCGCGWAEAQYNGGTWHWPERVGS